MKTLILNLLAGLAISAWSVIALAQAPVAGHVALVSGVVSAKSSVGETRVLKRGDAIYARDEISTAANSYANLRFIDDGRILLRPNTTFLIEAFNTPPSFVPLTQLATQPPAAAEAQQADLSKEGRSAFRLLRGAFRAVTGLIAKANRDNYVMVTPVVTVGIRGTDFGVYHDAADGSSSVAVYDGGVRLTALNGGAVQDLDKGQSARVDAQGNIAPLTEAPAALEATVADSPESCE